MTKRTNSGHAWRSVASFSIASVFMLLACGDSSTEPPPPGQSGYLEETFEFAAETDVQYGSATDENGLEEALLLDLYAPTNDGEGLRPAVVFLHGGSFQLGGKGHMTDFSERFARRGYVAVTANYRLRENAEFDYTDPDDPLAEPVKRDAQHDVQAAVRWLRANADGYRIDPDLIFVAGYSAGATTALRVAAYPDDPGTGANPDYSSEVAGAVAFAASLEPGVLEQATGATLLIHGDADRKVSFSDVETACGAVESCELVTIPGAGHNLLDVARETIIAETSTFLHARVTS